MGLTAADIQRVIGVLADSDWDEAVVTVGDVTIAVARNGATLAASGALAGPIAAAPSVAPMANAPVAAAPSATPSAVPVASAPAAAPAVAPTPSGAPTAAGSAVGVQVTAPSIGVFWRAPEPGSPPFVDVGQRVEVGQEMCIIEVMKLMNRVQAPVAGVVVAVHVSNGEAVESATPLFTIAPE